MKENIISFDEFINPNGNLKRFRNKNLDINDLEYCSYIKYFILEHCNGEIFNNYFIIDFDKIRLEYYYFDSYVIYAINVLDNIVCEVI